MAHFAELDSNNVVTRVIVVANQDVLDSNGNEDESVGIEYLKGLFGESTNWKQTSYNATQRARYAGKGFTYDPSRNVFLQPQPHPSWTVNETTTEWDSPIPMPEIPEGKEGWYEWNEEAYQADNTTGWVFNEIPSAEEE